jgi:hypothetical protein
MIRAAEQYRSTAKQSKIERVIFVLFTAGDYAIFEAEIRRIEGNT